MRPIGIALLTASRAEPLVQNMTVTASANDWLAWRHIGDAGATAITSFFSRVANAPR